MKLYIHYDITKKPWGGGNSFLKAFKKYCEESDIQLSKKINDNYDILFFNAASKSQTKEISIDELVKLKTLGVNNRFSNAFFPRKPKILVYRSDGFRHEYANMSNNSGDLIQQLSLSIADHVIFQNKSSLVTASRGNVGYCKNNYDIVYNGVDQELFKLKENFWNKKGVLKVFSANWSNNLNKGYETIARFSNLEGVELTFCGNWPTSVNKEKVKVTPALPQEELSKEYLKHDVFLHPSKYDQSPNVCLEAISCGLPIIFHNTSGIKEVAGECGIEVNEKNLNETYQNIINQYDSLVKIIVKNREYYSISRAAEEYINIFKKILDRKNKELIDDEILE
jgi:glycosyltransferase involved in cell wall biosynthesis